MPSDDVESTVDAQRWARLESECRVCGRRMFLQTSKRMGRCGPCRVAHLYEGSR